MLRVLGVGVGLVGVGGARVGVLDELDVLGVLDVGGVDVDVCLEEVLPSLRVVRLRVDRTRLIRMGRRTMTTTWRTMMTTMVRAVEMCIEAMTCTGRFKRRTW